MSDNIKSSATGASRDNEFVLKLVECQQNILRQQRYQDPLCLTTYGYKVYSQCDEDGFIAEICKRIGVVNRTFIEFGVGDGHECNTVRLLLDGWRGLWIDANDEFIASIQHSHRHWLDKGQLRLTRSLVTAENINTLFRESGLAGEIDILSIDIDRNDFWVWNAIEQVSPRIVVIEYNATWHPPLSWVVPYDPDATWDGSNYFGASLEALVRLADNKGYNLVGCSISGVNAFFIRKDLCGGLFLAPFTTENHYEPPRYFLRHLPMGHTARIGPVEIID